MSYIHIFMCHCTSFCNYISYLSFHIQRHSNLSDNDRTNLQTLLGVVITKLKYDKDYNFLNEVNISGYVDVYLWLCEN